MKRFKGALEVNIKFSNRQIRKRCGNKRCMLKRVDRWSLNKFGHMERIEEGREKVVRARRRGR